MIEPVNPFQGGVFNRIHVSPGTAAMDYFGLVQTIDRLCQSVVVRVTGASDRRLNTYFCQTLRVADRQVLASPVAVMDQAFGPRPRPECLLQRIQVLA